MVSYKLNRPHNFISLPCVPQESTSTKVIVDAMQMKSFEKDEEIITQGDDGDLFYVLEDGELYIESWETHD